MDNRFVFTAFDHLGHTVPQPPPQPQQQRQQYRAPPPPPPPAPAPMEPALHHHHRHHQYHHAHHLQHGQHGGYHAQQQQQHQQGMGRQQNENHGYGMGAAGDRGMYGLPNNMGSVNMNGNMNGNGGFGLGSRQMEPAGGNGMGRMAAGSFYLGGHEREDNGGFQFGNGVGGGNAGGYGQRERGQEHDGSQRHIPFLSRSHPAFNGTGTSNSHHRRRRHNNHQRPQQQQRREATPPLFRQNTYLASSPEGSPATPERGSRGTVPPPAEDNDRQQTRGRDSQRSAATVDLDDEEEYLSRRLERGILESQERSSTQPRQTRPREFDEVIPQFLSPALPVIPPSDLAFENDGDDDETADEEYEEEPRTMERPTRRTAPTGTSRRQQRVSTIDLTTSPDRVRPSSRSTRQPAAVNTRQPPPKRRRVSPTSSGTPTASSSSSSSSASSSLAPQQRTRRTAATTPNIINLFDSSPSSTDDDDDDNEDDLGLDLPPSASAATPAAGIDLTKAEEEEEALAAKMRAQAVALAKEEAAKPKKLAGIACVICMEDEPVDLSVTPCGHMFCHQCLWGAIKSSNQTAGGGGHQNKQVGRCPVCRGKVAIKDIIPLEILKGIRRVGSEGNDEDTKEKVKGIA